MGRQEFMRTHAFAVYTDANRPFLEMVGSKPIKKYPESSSWRFEIPHFAELASRDQSAAGLFLATYCQKERIPGFSHDLIRSLGASDAGNSLSYRYLDPGIGFGNLDFTWGIAPALAVAVADSFVKDGRISPQERSAYDLHDFADIIGSKWFGNLMQDASMTANGVWTVMAGGSSSYGLENLTAHVMSRGLPEKIFVTGQTQRSDNSPENSASFTKPFKHALREKMRESSRPSVGCPVGRKSTIFDRASLLYDRHALALVSDGVWQMHGAKEGSVRITQERTAIDMTLLHIAQGLRDYQNNFGMPYIVLNSNQQFAGVNWAHGRMQNGLFVAA